jgi:oligoendopeptidase F
MVLKRSEIPKEDRWNVEALFPKFSDWEKAVSQSIPTNVQPRWPKLAALKGRLHEGSHIVKEALDTLCSIDRELSLLHTYAHLRHDEDIANDHHKTGHHRLTVYYHDFMQQASWFEPELLSLPESLLQQYLKDPLLVEYRFHLEKIIRMKKHTLSTDNEELIAKASLALTSSQKTFSAINDADFKFEPILDSQGEKKELTHALYGVYLRSPDRTLRENAFKRHHSKYLEFENTLSELIQGQIQAHLFNARARNYTSCLEAALYPKNIDVSVYHALIKAVNDNIEILHRYVKLRKKILKVDKLHLYDLYVPLVAEIDLKVPYPEAETLVIQSSAALGNEYQSILKQGLQDQRWVDRYENENKRSGAYSSGCYDSMPYILMNYKDQIRDVFTLAHEVGHSMHSYLSHRHQPYHYSSYPIFLAEVASTFNEDLLLRLMLPQVKSNEEKIYLLNQKIEDIRTTLFRQTMFAEFELFLHECAEKNIPLTPTFLKEHYRQLNAKYFGNDVVIDKEAEIEWARIPHFYYNFYVFQYATGISAAMALAEQVVNGGKKERDTYLNFLKGGCSAYPIDMLRTAGVDMQTPEPVNAAIRKFGELVDQLEQLLTAKEKQKQQAFSS